MGIFRKVGKRQVKKRFIGAVEVGDIVPGMTCTISWYEHQAPGSHVLALRQVSFRDIPEVSMILVIGRINLLPRTSVEGTPDDVAEFPFLLSDEDAATLDDQARKRNFGMAADTQTEAIALVAAEADLGGAALIGNFADNIDAHFDITSTAEEAEESDSWTTCLAAAAELEPPWSPIYDIDRVVSRRPNNSYCMVLIANRWQLIKLYDSPRESYYRY
jgi:hypothetical protein